MMKLWLAVPLVAACAHGTSADHGDGQPGGDDSKIYLDAPIVRPDAAHPDARIWHDAPRPPPDAAIDAKVWRDAPPPDACVITTAHLLVNQKFDDSSPDGWTQQPIDSTAPDIMQPDPAQNQFPAQSNPNEVWLGGIPPAGTPLTDRVYQDVAIPAGTTQLVITGYYAAGSTETSSGVVDRGVLELVHTNGTFIETAVSLTNLSNASSWTAFSHTFTANVAGTTVRVRMTSTSNGDGSGVDYSNFFFDTLDLVATYCH